MPQPSPYGQIPATALRTPEPFHISVPDSQLSAFKALLQLSRIPAPTYESLQEDGRFGVSHAWMTRMKRRWEEEFDWRKSEDHMNSFPNFIATVEAGGDGEESRIHFVALFSERTDAVPVVLFHGWPGNFLEFLPILSLLKEKYTPATLPYHLIVPSLPGYAFSSTPPLGRDFGVKDVGAIMDQLMRDLGFGGGYVAQGGDIGSIIARQLGVHYEACKAVHINFLLIPSPPEGLEPTALTERDKKGIERGIDFVKMGSGYSLEHATRPSTIAFVLESSPLGLLAWIGEKFLEWTDENLKDDEILDSVTLYWFTESMGRGVYPYRSRFAPAPIPGSEYVAKPMGFSNFPKELKPTPRSWAETKGNLVFYKEHENGGHFAALEQPKLLLGDLEEFIAQVWGK